MGFKDVIINKFTFIFVGSLLFYVGFWQLAEQYIPSGTELFIFLIGVGLSLWAQFKFQGSENIRLIIKSVGRILFILGGGVLIFPWIEANAKIATILGLGLVLLSDRFATLLNGSL